MPVRTKRKGNPDVDKDGYPGPIGRGKGKGKAKSKAEESQALFYQRRAVDEAAALVAANRDELEGLRKGKADKETIREYEEELADSEHNLKIEKKALAEELAAEKIRSKKNPADAYLLEN